MCEPTDGHIVKRFDGELHRLHYRIQEMGALALNQVKDALRALKEQDVALARKIAQREHAMDLHEVNTDAEIVELLVRRCPKGSDLRMVMVVSKGVTDLERIGDEAVRIATISVQLCDENDGGLSEAWLDGVHVVGAMVVTAMQEALDAFDRLDAGKAREVIEGRRAIEDEFEAGLRRLMALVMEDPRNIGSAVSMVLIIKALERVGAHAQNLAEYVVYQVYGKDIRHSP